MPSGSGSPPHQLTTRPVERSLRGLALDRKSWIFAGSERGRQRAAFMYSLTGKRLEQGGFAWPKVGDGVMRLSPVQFEALSAGLDWRRIHAPRPSIPTARAHLGTRCKHGLLCCDAVCTGMPTPTPQPLDPDALPSGVPEAFLAMQAKVAGLEAHTERQDYLIAELRHAPYAKRSEQLDPDDRQLAFEDPETAVVEAEVGVRGSGVISAPPAM